MWEKIRVSNLCDEINAIITEPVVLDFRGHSRESLHSDGHLGAGAALLFHV